MTPRRIAGLDVTSRLSFTAVVVFALAALELVVDAIFWEHFRNIYQVELQILGLSGLLRLILVYFVVWPLHIHEEHRPRAERNHLGILWAVVFFMNVLFVRAGFEVALIIHR